MVLFNQISILIQTVWVFDIPPIYENCDFGEAECNALGAIKLHDFNHTVYAPQSIIVSCEPGQRSDGLPDWTWYAEGFKFQGSIPRYDHIINNLSGPNTQSFDTFYQL